MATKDSSLRHQSIARDDPQFVLNYLNEVEELAESVLSTKQHIIDLSKRMNSNREALAALGKNKVLCPPLSRNKVWVNMGGMFIKFKKVEITDMLRKDQKEIEQEISSSRKSLLPKVNKLRDAQGDEMLRGFDLAPLDLKELTKVRQ